MFYSTNFMSELWAPMEEIQHFPSRSNYSPSGASQDDKLIMLLKFWFMSLSFITMIPEQLNWLALEPLQLQNAHYQRVGVCHQIPTMLLILNHLESLIWKTLHGHNAMWPFLQTQSEDFPHQNMNSWLPRCLYSLDIQISPFGMFWHPRNTWQPEMQQRGSTCYFIKRSNSLKTKEIIPKVEELRERSKN